jgi:hypothetical protein
MNVEEGGNEPQGWKRQGQTVGGKMSVLHQMVPILFVIQFVLVLLALVSAMLFADPQVSLPARKSSRRDMARPITGPRA